MQNFQDYPSEKNPRGIVLMKVQIEPRHLASWYSCAYLLQVCFFQCVQGSHMPEKYLNILDCLEKSLKIKFALKSTGKTLKGL